MNKSRFFLLLIILYLIALFPIKAKNLDMGHSLQMVTVRLLGENGPTALTRVPAIINTDAEWKKILPEKSYKVLRAKGTEAAFCGNLIDNHQDGIYFCAGCALPLFTSKTKFNSGTGWPSFFKPFAQENIVEIPDFSLGMNRIEIACVRCGGHLGHVFHDGPPPTHLRYCLNSAALIFHNNNEIKKMLE